MEKDYLYTDKNGEEIKAGMLLRFPNGSFEKVYETTNMNGDADLGINASNEAFMKAHGIPEEYRVYYSLDNFRKDDIEIVHEEGAWKPGDICVVITSKKKRTTVKYRVLSYDGKYYHVVSNTGMHHYMSPWRLFHTKEEAVASLLDAGASEAQEAQG